MSPFNPLLYWFMFPMSVLIATCAVSAGIGGAALFGPLFLIIFPLLGNEYVIQSARGAVALAILIETFGFSSGLIGYYRRQLINFKVAFRLVIFSLPSAALSSLVLCYLELGESLKVLYCLVALLISLHLFLRSFNVRWECCFAICARQNTLVAAEFLLVRTTVVHDSPLFSRSVSDQHDPNHEPCSQHGDILDSMRDEDLSRADIGELDASIADNRITVLMGPIDYLGSAFGGILTGLLGVGTGEMALLVMLNRKYCFPVAAATSTLVVAATCAFTAIIQLSMLMTSKGSVDVPWDIILFAVPGVVIGAQIAVWFQGKVNDLIVLRCVATLFAIIGSAFLWLAVIKSHKNG